MTLAFSQGSPYFAAHAIDGTAVLPGTLSLALALEQAASAYRTKKRCSGPVAMLRSKATIGITRVTAGNGTSDAGQIASRAPDLPRKMEQIIYCDLEGPERAKYDELRAYYRASLLGLVDERGIERSQMHILEALLRLCQAACHPRLIDRTRAADKSAKITALLEQLDEVVAGGHKALVFSQFTSLLGIVKHHLDATEIRYEYLDGRTRDRQAKVDRFQSDAQCPVFLISLKAGGVGLNLTAAEYVFLLDPWWNPAVESQAIDRAHRIGQSRTVFAYRLIGRDTIEDKVLALQAQKKQLADAIITADNALLASIGRQELDLLLP